MTPQVKEFNSLLNSMLKFSEERDLVDEIIIRNCPCDIDKRTVYCTLEAIHMAMAEYHQRKNKIKNGR